MAVLTPYHHLSIEGSHNVSGLSDLALSTENGANPFFASVLLSFWGPRGPLKSENKFSAITGR